MERGEETGRSEETRMEQETTEIILYADQSRLRTNLPTFRRTLVCLLPTVLFHPLLARPAPDLFLYRAPSASAALLLKFRIDFVVSEMYSMIFPPLSLNARTK